MSLSTSPSAADFRFPFPLQYSIAAKDLPARIKSSVDVKTRSAKDNFQHLNVNDGEVATNWFPAIIVVGAIVAIAGVFLALAAHQVLPQGVNAISRLGLGGQILSYGAGGLGLIVVVIGSVKTRQVGQQNSSIEAYSSTVSAVNHNAEIAEVENYYKCRLEADELFIIDVADEQALLIYFRDPASVVPLSQVDRVSYEGMTQKDAYLEWAKNHAPIVERSHFIREETLYQRKNSFESTYHPNGF